MSHVITTIFLVIILQIITETFSQPLTPNTDRNKRGLYQFSQYDTVFKPSQQYYNPFADTIIPTISPSYKTSINYGLGFNHNNYELNLLNQNYPTADSYVVNGRLLKPYEVMEKLHAEEELLLRNHLINTRKRLSFGRALYNENPYLYQGNYITNYIPRKDYSGRERPIPARPTFNQNHGPVALGSGSLGYIRLPNGVVYIGSGSLGYISEQQFDDSIRAKQQKLNLIPGPLSFGPP